MINERLYNLFLSEPLFHSCSNFTQRLHFRFLVLNKIYYEMQPWCNVRVRTEEQFAEKKKNVLKMLIYCCNTVCARKFITYCHGPWVQAGWAIQARTMKQCYMKAVAYNSRLHTCGRQGFPTQVWCVEKRKTKCWFVQSRE